MRNRIAVIVPMHNEENNIEKFTARLVRATEGCGADFTAICVDDGSEDASVMLAARALSSIPGSKIIELSRNFGKEAALLAGMDAVLDDNFDAAIIIDADLQHPPETIPRMVELWREGFDVVVAARKSRMGDSWIRRILTKLFYLLINYLAEVRIVDGDGDFRLLTRSVVTALCELREQDRFTKGLYSWVGFKQTRIFVEYDQRAVGESRFNLKKLSTLAGTALIGFSVRPLRLSFYIGLIIGILSMLFAVWIALQTIFLGRSVPGYASIFCGFTFLGGLQLMSIGLLGEYVGKAYMQVKRRPPYVVRRVIEKTGVE